MLVMFMLTETPPCYELTHSVSAGNHSVFSGKPFYQVAMNRIYH